jgi:hypothetical protein
MLKPKNKNKKDYAIFAVDGIGSIPPPHHQANYGRVSTCYTQRRKPKTEERETGWWSKFQRQLKRVIFTHCILTVFQGRKSWICKGKN